MRNINETIAFVFLDIAVVIIVARAAGKLFAKIGQPPVVGEIVAGILLGPTLLGAFPGHLDARLFPTDIRPYLTVLANLGLVLFMFIVGIEVDLALVRGRERIATSVSLVSVIAPFSLGLALAALIYSHHDRVGTHKVTFIAFSLFVGVAMSITAFPVLARILADRGMQRTSTGVLSLACAAVDDVLAWILLAVVVAVTIGGDFTGVVEILLKTAAFALVMFLVVRPLLRMMLTRYERAGQLTPDMLAVILVGVLLASYTTQEIGIHFIFGAFVFGVVMPRQGAAAMTHEVLERLEQVSILLLLPIFFVVTGLAGNVRAIGGRGVWELALVLLVAIAGKFGGAFFASRVQRVPRRQSAALATLMNTRGLTELVILQVGVQLKVLDQTMFSLLVVMAVVTTFITTPLLKVFYPARLLERDIDEAERASIGLQEAYTVLVITDQRAVDADLVRFACDLVGREDPASLIIARLLSRRSRLEVATGLGIELAEIAAAGDELRRLATIADGRGVSSTVHSSLSEDRLADAADLATRAQADLILVYEDWVSTDSAPGGASGSWPRDLEAAVVSVAPSFAAVDGRVVAVLDGHADDPAVLRLATQVSLARAVGLELTAGASRSERRVGHALGVLRRVGIAARSPEAGSGLDGAGVVFTGWSAGPPSDSAADSVVRVRGGQRDADRDLAEIAAHISLAPVGPVV